MNNEHDQDAYWVHCDRCSRWYGGIRNHRLRPVYPQGCNHGNGSRVGNWHFHLLVLRDGKRCFACRQELHLEIQHVLPRSKGGTNCLHNLVLLCHSCHVRTFRRKDYSGIPKLPATLSSFGGSKPWRRDLQQ